MGELSDDFDIPLTRHASRWEGGSILEKYSDRDVMKHRSLQRHAMRYLATYSGTFEYLVTAKLVMIRDGRLSVPMIRGTLNCMRHRDDLMAGLPRPGYDKSIRNGFNENTFITIKEAFEDSSDGLMAPTLKEEQVKTIYPTQIKADFKLPFMWSTVKPSWNPRREEYRKVVFHSMEEEKSYGLWISERVNDWRYKELTERPTVVWYPVAACGQNPKHWAIGSHPPEGYEFCGNCRRRGAGLEAVNSLGRDTSGRVVRYGMHH